MLTQQQYGTWCAAFTALLLCSACNDNPTGSVDQLPACDPVKPQLPCEPRPTDPRLVLAIQVADGDTQVANVGSSLPKPLTILVTNRNHAALANVAVRWSTSSDASLNTTTTLTDANGQARVQLTLGSSAGEFATTASVEGNQTASVRFTSIAQVNGAYRISASGGDDGLNQSDSVFARLRFPYKVKVIDFKGAPVAGVSIQWKLHSNGSLSALTTVTDENGVAQVTHTLGSRVTAEVVEAAVAGLVGSPFVFVTYVTAGRTVSLQYVRGDGQLGVVNSDAAEPYVVNTTDAYGNQTAPTLDWKVEGGGSIRLVNPLSAVHKLGPAPGAQRVTATLPGTSQSLAFTTNAVSAIVGVGDCYYTAPGFNPQEVTIQAGGVVAWLWYSGYCGPGHNITFEDDPGASSPSLSAATFTRKFTAPATVRYRCSIHSSSFTEGEVGVIKVQ